MNVNSRSPRGGVRDLVCGTGPQLGLGLDHSVAGRPQSGPGPGHLGGRPPLYKGDQKAENAEKSRKYEAKDGAKLNGVRRCDGLQEPRFSGRRLGFCTISGPELVWPRGVLRVVASFSSSAEGRYAPDVLQRRPTEDWQLRSLQGPRPNEAQKRRCSGNVAAAVAEPTPYRPSASPSRRRGLNRVKPCTVGASRMESGVPMRSRVRRPRRSSPDR